MERGEDRANERGGAGSDMQVSEADRVRRSNSGGVGRAVFRLFIC